MCGELGLPTGEEERGELGGGAVGVIVPEKRGCGECGLLWR